jgi:RNA polymerase sigma factor for flagellar operon FliA
VARAVQCGSGMIALKQEVAFDQILAQPAANDTRADEAEHLEMVRRIAGALVRHLPSHIDKDELISLGYMGLVEAHKRWDRSRGVPFGAFAAMRVRGAMLDYLRQLDPVSRDERARLRTSDEHASVTLVDFACAASQACDQDAVDEELVKREQRALLFCALGKLNERERLVVKRYFFEEQPLKKVGEELGVTESRVCQIVSQVTARLRQMVGSEEEAA